MKTVDSVFPDPALAAKWQRLFVLRRRLIGSLIFFGGVFALSIATAAVSETAGVAFMVIVALPSFVVVLLTELALLNFRCPNCKRRFVLTLFAIRRWRKRCPHCGVLARVE